MQCPKPDGRSDDVGIKVPHGKLEFDKDQYVPSRTDFLRSTTAQAFVFNGTSFYAIGPAKLNL